MKTKFDINEKVFITAKIINIEISKDEVLYTVETNDRYTGCLKVKLKENQITKVKEVTE